LKPRARFSLHPFAFLEPVTARAEQLELDEVVTSTADERDPVVDFQLLGGAAPDADAIACVVAVLVTADTRPKDLSRVLDEAFEDWDAVLQFVVEGLRLA
jgi:hypothetical protein